MKTSIITFLFFLLVNLLAAQPAAIRSLAAQYPEDHDERSELTLSGSWLKMLTKANDSKKQSNGYLREIHFLSVPAPANLNARKLSNQLESEGYELLTSFRSNKDQGYILIREENDGETELIATFTGEENKLTTITVGGRFSWEDLDDLDIDIDGWGNLKKKR